MIWPYKENDPFCGCLRKINQLSNAINMMGIFSVWHFMHVYVIHQLPNSSWPQEQVALKEREHT